MFHAYLNALVSKVFKILPLFQEDNEGFFGYFRALLDELHGLDCVIEELRLSNDYISLIATLESLYNNTKNSSVTSEQVKSTVFKCIGIVKRMMRDIENLGEVE